MAHAYDALSDSQRTMIKRLRLDIHILEYGVAGVGPIGESQLVRFAGTTAVR